METILVFFRDVLDGPLYVAVFVVCLILIFVCISGIRKNILAVKEKKEKANLSKVILLDPTGGNNRVEIDMSKNDNSILSSPVPTAIDAVIPNFEPLIESSNVSAPSALDAVLPNNEAILEDVNGIVEEKKVISSEIEQPKKVVMIDPSMVAAVSSTLNVIGHTNENTNVDSNLNQDVNTFSGTNINNTLNDSSSNQNINNG